ncbi:hypothetical protein NIES4071_75430 [Calothrix sp. NIES-4071]|nr:hypothetical protein NIES4071_75430 [Calothrix sp. NIES-4071]BAZ61818.1 hypothetical protein NIES4105_75380 [Calothrix sp. NIES-4105]
MNVEQIALETRDRLEIVDALYRFVAGIDFNNEEFFVSALAPDSIVDMTPGNKLWGLSLPVFEGRDIVIEALKNSVCLLDTTHAVTNPRTVISGDTAKLYAIVEAQHLPSNDHSRHCLMKNQYEASLVRSCDKWVIKHLRVDGVWFTGEPSVLMGQ